ncbi:MAG: mevalonate kinase [Chloroflexi bacterium]|nr:mevalonate kinase [Chloroflexota bacterium]
MTKSYAPGKVILFGEHAVVYGRPAIAVPLFHLQAVARVVEAPPGQGIIVDAPDLRAHYAVREAPADDPHAATIRNVLACLGCRSAPDITVTLSSTIPVASGLGSGAAVATALVRALAAHLGRTLSPAEVSALVYETEKLHHGTPSGIDNTVIAYEQPIYFVRGRVPEPFAAGGHLPLVIADSGVPSPTKVTVGDVRKGWRADRARYEALFDEIAEVARLARTAIEKHRLADVGRLMNRNHQLLCALDVSSALLDRLVEVAGHAGAWGAKLSGGGRGGNVIALAAPAQAAAVAQAMRRAGAVAVFDGRQPVTTW